MNSDSHLFLLIEHNVFVSTSDYMQILQSNTEKVIYIPTKVISYINDTLVWVDTVNPSSEKSSFSGLNPFGPTIIEPVEARRIQLICDAWIGVFGLGPDQIHLTGEWVNNVDENGNELQGYYEDVCISRADIIGHLQSISSLAQASNDGDLLILHYGL
ncbi:MAG: hypothetical protein SH847_12385 [Roseiflexaceae bacterium]|nr:hypothetical protein [Roseiflexaceae bacterium]